MVSSPEHAKEEVAMAKQWAGYELADEPKLSAIFEALKSQSGFSPSALDQAIAELGVVEVPATDGPRVCLPGFPRAERRSNHQKRQLVASLLRNPDAHNWSDRRIASALGVSHWFVGKVRSELFGESEADAVRVGLAGK